MAKAGPTSGWSLKQSQNNVSGVPLPPNGSAPLQCQDMDPIRAPTDPVALRHRTQHSPKGDSCKADLCFGFRNNPEDGIQFWRFRTVKRSNPWLRGALSAKDASPAKAKAKAGASFHGCFAVLFLTQASNQSWGWVTRSLFGHGPWHLLAWSEPFISQYGNELGGLDFLFALWLSALMILKGLLCGP